MEFLQELSYNKIDSVRSEFIRSLYYKIDWNDRLIAIRGARGVGKTTLILQYLKNNLPPNESLYLSLDHILFQKTPLFEVVDYYAKLGIKNIFLDEVHKYPDWSIEIKNIYDFYQELKIIFTGSSVLELYKGQADLSRRMMAYDLCGLSFREFLIYDQNITTSPLNLEDILEDHVKIARELKATIGTPLLHFNKYLRIGYYPYYKENESNYQQRLLNTINLILESDIVDVENITYNSIRKMKSLLYIISQSVPFKPNISSLSKKVETKRDTLLQFLDLLQRASLINLLRSNTQGVSFLNKPEKIYLNNTNLLHALGQDPDKGNERETFFLNQMSYKNKINSTTPGDFIVEDQFIFEVGGKNKTNKQIQTLNSAYIAADDIEIGAGNRIPLWLFGFLY